MCNSRLRQGDTKAPGDAALSSPPDACTTQASHCYDSLKQAHFIASTSQHLSYLLRSLSAFSCTSLLEGHCTRVQSQVIYIWQDDEHFQLQCPSFDSSFGPHALCIHIQGRTSVACK